MERSHIPASQSIEDGKTGSVGEEDTAKAAPSTAQHMVIDVDAESWMKSDARDKALAERNAEMG